LLKSNFTVGVINRSYPKDPNLSNFQNFKSFCYDGSEDSIKAAIVATAPQIVVHLASYFVPRHKPQDVSPLISSNIDFPSKLIDIMSQMGVNKFINTGTYWQHYQDAPYDPISLYAATKQAFEDILQYYVNTQKIDAITLKLFDTYGVGDTRRKVLNLLLDAAISEESLQLSPGEQRINLVNVDDVVKAYEVAINIILNRSGYQHDLYGIADRTTYSLHELAEIVAEVSGKKIQAEWGALPYRDREVMKPWSTHKILPDWQPTVTIREGLIQIVEREI